MWNLETGYGPNNFGWGNNEWQLYTTSPDNVRVENDYLVIQARCDTPPCGVRDGSVTSARINTKDKFEFRYGTVVARIKPPVGKHSWPAFWSLGASFPDTPWPRAGEIDFMEMHNEFSDENTAHFTMHWCDETKQAPLPCTFPEGWVFDSQNTSDRPNNQPPLFDSSLGDDFHIFSADWTPDGVIGRIDGIPYFQLDIDPATMEEFLNEFFLILNVAMGGTLGSNSQPPDGDEVWPQTMLVDYVRVFQTVDEVDGVIDFEGDASEFEFSDFEGGVATIVDNPFPEGINTSATVGRMQKFAGQPFAGSTLDVTPDIDVVAGSTFTMKVFSPRPVAVLFQA